MSGKRGKILKSQSREIILAVDRYFEQERNQYSNAFKIITKLSSENESSDLGITLPKDLFDEIKGLLQNTKKVTSRVVAATGISKNTVSRIRSEGALATATSSKITAPKKGKRGPKYNIDNFDICAIKGIVESMYDIQKTIPTVDKILIKAQQELNFPGEKTMLRKILKEKLGYRFKKCSQKRMQLVERPIIRALRAQYLRRIQENDALWADKKSVVYLGETWIQSQYTVSKSSALSEEKKNDSPSSGNRWIIIHAGNEYGFVNGALALWKSSKTGIDHGQISDEKFSNWISNKLLPNIPPHSIIVMDNASYHNVETNKIPTLNSKKNVLQDWLTTKEIEYSDNLTKVELFQLIKQNRPPKDYAIDNLLRSYGHEVLRLPPYNYDLNPIEYVWHLVKQRLAAKMVHQMESKLEALTLDVLASITADDWCKYMNHVKSIEQRYWDKEQAVDIHDFLPATDNSDGSDTEDEEPNSEYEESSDDVNMSGIEELE